jgi:hypothetical protein
VPSEGQGGAIMVQDEQGDRRRQVCTRALGVNGLTGVASDVPRSAAMSFTDSQNSLSWLKPVL